MRSVRRRAEAGLPDDPECTCRTVHWHVTELHLERMVHGGACLARLPDGKLALVQGGIPGETVLTELKSASGVLQGFVETVVVASPDRVEGTEHPGLDLDHVSYPRQLQLKQDIVQDALQRALPRDVETPPVLPAVAAPRVWGYRNTVQPVVSRGELGYRWPGSHEVKHLESDVVANAGVQAAWQVIRDTGVAKGVRELAIRGNDKGEALVALIAAASPRNYLEYAHDLVRAGLSGVSYAEYDPRGRFRRGSRRLTGTRQITERFGRFELSMTAVSFAQPNAGAASQLYLKLQELAGQGELAQDLYAGAGAISFHLADGFRRVLAYEIDQDSVKRGRSDAERLGISNVEFEPGDVKRLELGPAAELITVDPPRAGLGREVRELIQGSSARSLVYVSCDAATWARDVAEFLRAGWRLTHAEPFDFYPHTHHVELLSRLDR